MPGTVASGQAVVRCVRCRREIVVDRVREARVQLAETFGKRRHVGHLGKRVQRVLLRGCAVQLGLVLWGSYPCARTEALLRLGAG